MTALVAAPAWLPSFHSLQQIKHPSPVWTSLALLAQLASLVAYALVVRGLLGIWGIAARTRLLLRATVGGIAMGASLPGGQALSTAYWYRQLRRVGAGRTVAAFALAATMVAGALSLAGLIVVGVAVAGRAGPLADLRLPILVGAAALLALRLAVGRRFGRLVLAGLRRLLPGLPTELAVRRRRLVAVGVLACLNWLLDCACLLAALNAVGASVPLRSVLLTYGLAQIVANVPVLPGGGGTVELSMSLGFAAFGHTSGATVAGVLLYRTISCWGLVPVGWLAVAVDSRRVRARWSRRCEQPAGAHA